MSPLAFLRSLDARAIALALAAVTILPLVLSLLTGMLAFELTGSANVSSKAQSIFAAATFLLAPILAGTLGARLARSTPLTNGTAGGGIIAALIGILGDSDSAWTEVLICLGAACLGVVGALVGRAWKTRRSDI